MRCKALFFSAFYMSRLIEDGTPNSNKVSYVKNIKATEHTQKPKKDIKQFYLIIFSTCGLFLQSVFFQRSKFTPSPITVPAVRNCS